MFNNKTIIFAIAIVAAVAIGIITFSLTGGKSQTAELPVVNENISQTSTSDNNAVNPETTIPVQDSSYAGLPESDSDPALVIPETTQPAETAAPEDAKEAETKVVEKTPDQVAADNKKIKEGQKAAETNPDTQKVDVKPVVTEPATPAPKTYADGSMYTKQQAIDNFKKIYQKCIDTNDYNYTGALEEAKEQPGFTQESFDADLTQLMNDPYSSPALAEVFEDYRKDGNFDILLVACVEWLSLGGDDGKVANRSTN